MKAVILKDTGGVNQLSVEDIAKPAIKADEILIKTKFFGINPIDMKIREGNRFSEKLLNDKPSILGWDVSGIVKETGEKVAEFQKEDRVFGMIGFPDFGRTYAEYVVAKERDLCKIPNNKGFLSAAATPLAALTAYQALKDYGKLAPGKKVLIHAASGGVGHFGVQIAKHFGAEVIATASDGKREFVSGLGADRFIDYREKRFEDVVSDVDVVFDLIGGDYIDRSLKILKKGGVLISIPSSTNADVEEKAAAQNCTGVRFILEPSKTDLEEITRLMANEELQPFVSKEFSIDQIKDAHNELEKGHTKGKIVLSTT